MKNIATILTVHNRKLKTTTCLRNLFKTNDIYNVNKTEEERIMLTVFITDDGCTDGTTDGSIHDR